MEQIRIVQPPEEKFSWVKEFTSTNVGEKFKYPKQYKKTVSPIKSRDVKLQMPDAEFEEDSKTDKGFVIVERIK
ncbi:hypothetical protein ACJVDH_00160 [Pedobacter sp. AW1-32]|uniref:hypothetical protein n=1 Tax=Pedobacter sp. AW1-32 TaxID=3383026 RepID=UPI003FEDBE7B